MPHAPATAAGHGRNARRRLAPLVLAVALLAGPGNGLWSGPTTARADADTHFAQAQAPAPPPALSGYRATPVSAAFAEIARITSAWERVLAEHDPEAAFVSGRHLPAYSLKQWKNLATLMPGLDRAKQLRYINGFFNNLPSQKDMVTYGQDDYWATPEEFMRAGAGDCEDYAIAKYLALKHFGWPTSGMWILLVQRLENREHHAVLAVQNGKTLFILDNLSRPAYLLVPQETFMKAFVPLFALNEGGFWLFARQ